MVRRRLRESERSFCSGLSFFSSTPARSARSGRAPRLSVFSMSSTKVKTSPERSQPKQYQDCIWGLTLKLGLSSWWKGQRPQRSLLRLVRRTCSWTTFTRSTLALTSAKASSDVEGGIGIYCPRNSPWPRLACKGRVGGGWAADEGTGGGCLWGSGGEGRVELVARQD